MTNVYRTPPQQEFKAEQEARRAGINAWTPDRYIARRVGKQRRKVEEIRRPLCPGYIFADAKPVEARHIRGKVGTVQPHELDALRSESGKRPTPEAPKADPDPVWHPGDLVEVINSPLAGVKAMVVEVRGKVAIIEGDALGSFRRIGLHIRQLKAQGV